MALDQGRGRRLPAQPGGPEITDEEATSQLTGRTNHELAAEGEVRSRSQGAGAGGPPPENRPSRHRRGARRPQGPAAHLSRAEPGSTVREAAERAEMRFTRSSTTATGSRPASMADAIRLLTRKALDWTVRFRPIADALAELGLGSALIDGEIVVEDTAGISSFSSLQADLSEARRDRFRYLAFDLLYCEGFDLTKTSLRERKTPVAGGARRPAAEFGDPLQRPSQYRWTDQCWSIRAGWASKASSPSVPTCRIEAAAASTGSRQNAAAARNSSFWVTSPPRPRAVRSAHCCSATTPKAGSSMPAASAPAGRRRSRSRCASSSKRSARGKPPLRKPLPAGADKGAIWAAPNLVCEVEFREWTRDGLIRQAVVQRAAGGQAGAGCHARRSRDADQVPCPGSEVRSGTQGCRRPPDASGADPMAWARHHQAGAGGLLHRHRRLDSPACHRTGAERIASALRHRSQGLLRQACLGGPSDAVERVDVGEEEPMLAIHDLRGLMHFVQASAVELHPWGSRADRARQS